MRLVHKRKVPVSVGPVRPYGSGKRGSKAGTLTVKQWKAANRHKHTDAKCPPNKNVVYWKLGYWYGGAIK